MVVLRTEYVPRARRELPYWASEKPNQDGMWEIGSDLSRIDPG